MKRILSAILSLCLVLSACTVGFSASAATPKKVTTLTDAAAKQHFKRLYDYIDKNGKVGANTNGPAGTTSFKAVKLMENEVECVFLPSVPLTENVYFEILNETQIIMYYVLHNRAYFDAIECILERDSAIVRSTYYLKRWKHFKVYGTNYYEQLANCSAQFTMTKSHSSYSYYDITSPSDGIAVNFTSEFGVNLPKAFTAFDSALNKTLGIGVNHLGFYDYDGSIYCVPGKDYHIGDRDYAGGSKATFTKDGSTGNLVCHNCGSVVGAAEKYARVSKVSLSATKFTYNGKVKTPSVTVKDSKGKTLTKNVDYTVAYAKGRKNVGKYAVTVTLKGNYSGKKTLYFTIIPKATKLKTVSAGKKKLTVKWSKQSSQTSGYEIQYSTSKKFKGAKTVKISKNKTTSKTIKSLKAKKKYYVRIRTYKTVGKTKYYSAWSNAKNKTTKK